EDDRLRLVAAYGFDDPEDLSGLTLPIDSKLINAELLRTGQPMVIDDVQRESGWLSIGQLPESSDIHGWLGAPLKVRDRVVGVVNVDSHQVGAYGSREIEVVSAFADHAATAVANARLFADSQRQVRATEALAETARVVTGSLDLEDVPQRILRQTARSLDAKGASLAMVDEESGELEFRVATGDGAEDVVGFRLPLGRGIAGWVAEHKEATVVADAQADPRFHPGMDDKTGITTRNVVCAPILVQGELMAVLEAVNVPSDGNPSEQLRLLKGIAGLAGTALAHAQLFSETQSARERYAGLFNDSIDPILITDLTGEITEANHRAETFLGVPLDSLLGQEVRSIYTADTERLPADLADIKDGETISYNAEATHQEGKPLPVEVHVKRIDIDREPHLQWILRDISERLELDELRSDLTSMIFHDLRSPLGNVMSSLEMLQDSISEGDETLHAILSIAQRSSRRLSRLVDSLLDLGQLEAGQAVLHEEPASLAETVREAVEEVEPLSEAKGHELSFEIPDTMPTVEIDVDMIRRVVINLLENAIKYTRTGGQIHVELESDSDSQVVHVSDTGPGILPRYQQQIFDKFSRIHHEGRPKGLGLGLAFCRLAVEAHGGTIWVESEQGKGSTFSFRLPIP
ncbi:MAG: GAF domain-containing protein, partial [Anaerolineales bacterium]